MAHERHRRVDHDSTLPILAAERARLDVLAQHDMLRSQLVRMSALARIALEGDAGCLATIDGALTSARAAFEHHLMFEESVIVPLLRADAPVGDDRADKLLDEHERQRAMLGTLAHEALACSAAPMLAVKLQFLVDWLLADMAEEEQQILTANVLREDLVPREAIVPRDALVAIDEQLRG